MCVFYSVEVQLCLCERAGIPLQGYSFRVDAEDDVQIEIWGGGGGGGGGNGETVRFFGVGRRSVSWQILLNKRVYEDVLKLVDGFFL